MSEEQEVFEKSIYDTLLINNKTVKIDDFDSYLIIGSDQNPAPHLLAGVLLKVAELMLL